MSVPWPRPSGGQYRGTSLIRCGDSKNGRWHVLNFKNVLEKRSVVRLKIKNVHEKRSVLKYACLNFKKHRKNAQSTKAPKLDRIYY